MAEARAVVAACSDEAEQYVSASSEDDTPQQEVTPELLAALVKQVEFYFSDANLPTDKKLLKQIRKDPLGFVPVKLFSNFRKVRALSKEVAVITQALHGSSLLELSADGRRVRRVAPVPEYDISEIQRRTVVVENLPGSPTPTIESVTELFSAYGRVKLVRICSRDSKGKLPAWLTSPCQAMAGHPHAFVEFEEEEGAVLAAAALAAEVDAADGAVQVRRLLACIAEQRDYLSSGGTACASPSIASRRGSREPSPLCVRRAGSRHGSGGGGAGASSPRPASGSCSPVPWTSPASHGGAAADLSPNWRSPPSPYRQTYGGASGADTDNLRGSGGGYGFATSPPPPPPPRSPPAHSYQSASAWEQTPAAARTLCAPTSPILASPGQGSRPNAYRPPAKRLSDGYSAQGSGTGTFPGGAATPSSPLLQRSCGGSFNSSCGGSFNNSMYLSSGATPVAVPVCPYSPVHAPPPPPLPRAVPSPPLATRTVALRDGEPAAAEPPLPLPYAVPVSLEAMEAIAAAKAGKRASDLGGESFSTMRAPSLTDAGALPPAMPVSLARCGTASGGGAPADRSRIFGRCRSAGGAGRGDGHESDEEANAVNDFAFPGAAFPGVTFPGIHGSQMVDNVEEFMNDILSPIRTVGAAPPPPSPPPRSPAGTPRQPISPFCAGPPSPVRLPCDAVPYSLPAALFGLDVVSEGDVEGERSTASAPLREADLEEPTVTVTISTPASPLGPKQRSATPSLLPILSAIDICDMCSVSVGSSPSASPSKAEATDAAADAAAADAPDADAAAGAPDAVAAVASSPQRQPQYGRCYSAAAPHSPPPPLPPPRSLSSVRTAAAPPPPPPPPRSPPLARSAAAAPPPPPPRSPPLAQHPQSPQMPHSGGGSRGARRDYSAWAAATPEFRAEAAGRQHVATDGGAVAAGVGGAARCYMGGVDSPTRHYGGCVPGATSISDGGAPASAPASPIHAFHATVHVAKGPDGTRGFVGRRPLVA